MVWLCRAEREFLVLKKVGSCTASSGEMAAPTTGSLATQTHCRVFSGGIC